MIAYRSAGGFGCKPCNSSSCKMKLSIALFNQDRLLTEGSSDAQA